MNMKQNNAASLSSRRQHLQLPVFALFFLFIIVLVRNAWLSDDAYITFRTIDNFLNGYGLRWNVAERVQSFTHPLWLFFLTPFHFLAGEVYFSTLLACALCTTAAVYMLAKGIARNMVAAAIAIVVLALSRAFVDFSTSGLENPLTHLLLAWFLVLFFRARYTTVDLRKLAFVAGLIALNRLDMILVCFPPLALFFVRNIRGAGKHKASRAGSRSGLLSSTVAAFVGFLPLLIWEIFSIIYYGFPFPNTAYAKLSTGIEGWRLAQQGFYYYVNSLATDPLTLLTISTAVLLALTSRKSRHAAVALGIVLYLVYIVRIGGDFMSGRFFSGPLFAAVCLLSRQRMFAHNLSVAAFTGLTLIAAGAAGFPTLTLYPPLADVPMESMDVNGIADERRFYHNSTGLLQKRRDYVMPYRPAVATAWKYRTRGPKVAVGDAVGIVGYFAGPSVYLIDKYALTDPLLARLPARKFAGWRIGHFERTLPTGYFDSITSGPQVMSDKNLGTYYAHIQSITRDPVFSGSRLLTALKMNLGQYDELLAAYPPASVIDITQVSKQAVRDRQTSGVLTIPVGGLICTIKPVSHARTIHVGLDSDDTYHVRFLNAGNAIATVTIDAQLVSAGVLDHVLKAPEEAILQGYDYILVEPEFGDGQYRISHLELLDSQDSAKTN